MGKALELVWSLMVKDPPGLSDAFQRKGDEGFSIHRDEQATGQQGRDAEMPRRVFMT